MSRQGWFLTPVLLVLAYCIGCAARGRPAVVEVRGRAVDEAIEMRGRSDRILDELIRKVMAGRDAQGCAAAVLASADESLEPLPATLAAVRKAQDVVIDNLCNAETTGYKATQSVFVPGTKRLMLQRNFEQGPLANTNRSLDVAIEGEGLLVVKVTSRGFDGFGYVRNGNLFIDPEGQLVVGLGKGHRLWPAVTMPRDTMDISISQTGIIECIRRGVTSRLVAGRIQLRDSSARSSLGGWMECSWRRRSPGRRSRDIRARKEWARRFKGSWRGRTSIQSARRCG